MSVEPRRDFLSIPWCPGERRGNRSLFREGEQSENKIVFFGQSTERLYRSMERPAERYGYDYDGILRRFGMVHGDNGRIQPISEALPPTETGHRRPEIGDRMEWTDPWSFNGHSPQSIHQSLSTSVTREEDNTTERAIPRRKESQVVDFYRDRRGRFSGIRRGSRIKGGHVVGCLQSIPCQS